MGCAACMNACPLKCIILKRDNEGFEYPCINEKLCSGCGKCIDACPIRNVVNRSNEFGDIIAVYAAKNVDNGIRRQSSSGGIFYLLAKEIIRRGGIVVGAAFNSEQQVEHIIIDTVDEISRIMGSKYVQSASKWTLASVNNYLKQGPGGTLRRSCFFGR